MRLRLRSFFRVAPLFCVACLLPAVASAKTEWAPISPEDLASTECKAFPGASAEVLLISQTFSASREDSWTTQNKQIKIYSLKGAEERGVMNIDYDEHHRVWDLAARVTKPDGHSTEFRKDDFHDSDFLKVDGYKWKRKTLAVPNLSEGDIVELTWTQSATTYVGSYFWWYCQLNIPVRHYLFAVDGSRTDYKVFSYNAPGAEIKQVHGYQMRLDMHNLAPFDEEPSMAPTRDVRGWFLVLFTSNYMRWFSQDESSWWKEISSYYAENYHLLTKPDAIIKKTAVEAVRGAANDGEKLKRLYDFCQQHVSNFDYFDSPDLQKAKKKLDDSQSPQSPPDTLNRGSGYSRHVNELFASLARAIGFEVRQARSASRNTTLLVRNPSGWLFLDDDLVAIRQGQAWRLYAPGDYYVPCEMLDQSNESATSLICDEKEVIFEENPVSPAEKSPVVRRGHFTLDAEGNLEGDVEVSIEGHRGIKYKKKWRNLQPADIDIDYRTSVTGRLPAAEVGDLAWENVQGNKWPLVVRYKVKIPGYADIAGAKIILTPNVFEHGSAVQFTAENREYPICFDYAWSEHDDIEITLPDGYTLDAASAPVNIGDTKGTLGSRYTIGYKPKSRVLTYKRDFSLGANRSIAFQAASYPALKALFESIHRSDEHTIVLKPKPAAAIISATTAAGPNTESAK